MKNLGNLYDRFCIWFEDQFIEGLIWAVVDLRGFLMYIGARLRERRKKMNRYSALRFTVTRGYLREAMLILKMSLHIMSQDLIYLRRWRCLLERCPRCAYDLFRYWLRAIKVRIEVVRILKEQEQQCRKRLEDLEIK